MDQSASPYRFWGRLIHYLLLTYPLLSQRWHRPEPALPPLKFSQGLGQVGFVEVRPHAVGEEQLGVGALPKQEVREPPFTTGADQQVYVKHRLAIIGWAGQKAR